VDQREHVHVTGRTSQSADPRELRREMLDLPGRKDAADLSEERSRSPGYAEVVKEFRVQPRPQSRLVGLENADERQMNLASPNVGADC